MKILTYNLWHGLAPSSALTMEFLEPEARRRARFAMQLKLLKGLNFDVGFFQEANPLLERSSQMQNELKMNSFFQSDLVGIKVLGIGLPPHLNSGLLTLGTPSLHLRKVEGFKLSGPQRSFVSPWVSFQLQEERYALFCELMHPDWGRVLMVNTHLHHGLELTEEFEKELRQRARELELSGQVEAEIFDRLQKGNQRRLREMKHLLGEVRRLEERYSVVILGGDMNSRPDSEVAQLLREYGFKDSFEGQTQFKELYTFDGEKNQANHKLQARFPLSVKFEDLSFSKKVTQSLKEILTGFENSPRRIDQLWVKAKHKHFRTQAELVGLEEDVGFAPSDHFGYMMDLEVY